MIILIYILLAGTIIFVEAQNRGVRRLNDAITLFNLAYFVLFVFAPLNVLVLGEAAVRQRYAYDKWGYGDVGTAAALLACYLAFVAGYFLAKRLEPRQVVESLFNGRNEILARRAFWLCGVYLAIGLVGFAYDTYQMGGLYQIVAYGPFVRTSEYRPGENWIFLRQFDVFWSTAFMLYWAAYETRRVENGGGAQRMIFGLAVLAALFVFYALSTNGRRAFWDPVLICILVSLSVRESRQWPGWRVHRTTFGILLIASVIFVGRGFFYSPSPPGKMVTEHPPSGLSHAGLSRSSLVVDQLAADVRTTYLNTVRGLADPFMHFVGAQHARLWQFGFLRDLGEIPEQLLPSKLLGFRRGRGMYGETSEFFLGHPLEAGLSGVEPLGLHGYLLVNFSYIGMVLVFFLVGVGYRAVARRLRPCDNHNGVGWLVYFWFIWLMFEWLREGALILILKPVFSWWLAALFVLLSARTSLVGVKSEASGKDWK